jgi:hypothetical protein
LGIHSQWRRSRMGEVLTVVSVWFLMGLKR